MRVNRKYLVAVALLAVLAVVFGLAGTVMPVSDLISPQQSSSSSDSVGHFQNPPTYDSGWVNITNRCGQYFTLNHGLNTTEVVVDITGKQSLDPKGGALAWSRTYGGAEWDLAYEVIQTSDGGYAIAGYTNSSGAGGNDFWLVKTDEGGNMQWSRTYGGTDDQEASSVIQTADGGYAIVGITDSGPGYGDFWLVKTDMHGNAEWNKTYGVELGTEVASGVVQTSDGGYAIAGSQSIPPAFTDFWLVKTDANGNMQWNKTYDDGGRDDIPAGGVVQTSDGGYAIAGYSGSLMWGDVADFWLVKIDSNGNAQWNRTYGGANWDFAYGVIQTSDGGYAVTGGTRPDPTPLNHAVLLIKTDQGGNMAWNRTYGGAIHDHAFSVIQMSDKGYAIAGFSSTDAGDVYTYTDFLLVRTDSVGNLVWNRTYGRAHTKDWAYSLVQTSDGGYTLAGCTVPFDSENFDFLLVKVDGEMNLEHQRNLGGTAVIPGWSQTYGGTSFESAWSVVQSLDGGYALTGHTLSSGAGGYDFWLVKTDSIGTVQWSRTYGGTKYDEPYSLIQTSDGGYAIAGYTESSGAGFSDFWLVKTDYVGNMVWNKTYGGTSSDQAFSVVQTSDGGYALAGWTSSSGAGISDFWLVKTDSAGNHLWNQTYGGASRDYGRSVIQTSDGGYALAGDTNSSGAGGYDFWLVKTDSAGNHLWNQTYGGADGDSGWSLVQARDGGYAIAGRTNSFGVGSPDIWLVKTDSVGNIVWNRTYGGAGVEDTQSLIRTSDGGYAIAGVTGSFGAGNWDFWLVKTDSTGVVQWSKTYGGTSDEYAFSVVQTNEEGYVIAGFTQSYGFGFWDFWLVKTDVEMGLTLTALTNSTITLYRGRTDPYWNYVRVRIWTIKEPTWQFGDINQDGVVDINDLAILSKNYGKTFSLLSLTGIIAIAGIHTYKKHRQ